MALGDRVSRFAPEDAFFRTGDSRALLNTSLNTFGVGDSYTVAAWVRFNSLAAAFTSEDIVRLFPAGNDNDILRLGLTSTGTAQFQFTASTSAGVVKNLTPVSPLPQVGRWYHVVGCKVGSSTMRIFINGEDVLTTGVTVPTTTDAARQISIGIDGRDSSGQLDADIHSVSLWDTAISEESVRAVYNGGYKDLDLRVAHPCYAEAPNLKHWWRFGQGATTTFSAGNEFMTDWVPSGGISITEEAGSVDDEDILLVGTNSRGTAMELDGSGGSLSSAVAVPIGIDNEWSISTWIKPFDVSLADQTILCICDNTAPSFQSVIQISIEGTSPDDPLRILLNTDNAALTEILREVDYEEVLSFNEWQHLLITWDGSTVKTYLNGVLLFPSSITGNAGVQSDNSRFVDLGADSAGGAPANFFDGLIGHTAVWNTVMDEDALCQVYSGGHCLDLRYNKDAYQIAENLKRYWKPGEDTQTPGRDFTSVFKSTSVPLTIATGATVIVGDSPEVIDPIPGERKSVNLDGLSERYANNTKLLMSIANEWSISTWVNPSQLGATGAIFTAIDVPGLANGIRISHAGVVGAGRLQIDIRASAGNPPPFIKIFRWEGVLSVGIWTHLLVTWDGVDLRLYADGLEIAPNKQVDSAGTMTDNARRVFYGTNSGSAQFEGNLGHLAIWNRVLGLSEVLAVFAGKFSFDARVNQGFYSSAGNLMHYYRPGFKDEGFEDLGSGTPLIDFTDSVNIDADDIEINSPPC